MGRTSGVCGEVELEMRVRYQGRFWEAEGCVSLHTECKDKVWAGCTNFELVRKEEGFKARG